MRILQLTQFLPPVPGGEERHVATLARELAARGHQVTLLGFATGADGPGTHWDDGVRVVRVATAAARLPLLYSDAERPHAPPLPDPAVSRAIRAELADGYDVAHAHNWIVNSALAPTARAGVPLVLTLHDYSHVCATKRLMERGVRSCPGPAPSRCLSCAGAQYGRVKGALTLAANAVSARRRTARVAAAAAVSSAVAAAAGKGLHPSVIPNFIPADLVLDEVRAPDREAPLVYVGDLSADKGVGTLLAAYHRLPAPPPLLLAGRCAQNWDFPAGARHLGVLSHPEVVALMRSAAAVVVPSVWGDPCPTVVLEAMAAGRPVVAAATGGIVDMVVDGRTGWLVAPGDDNALAGALTSVQRRPDVAHRFGLAGRDRVRQFTVAAVVPRLEAMYASVARHRTRTAEEDAPA